MAQLISDAAESAYTEFDTKIPELLEDANIIEALKLYHFGKPDFTTGDVYAAASIYGNFKALQDQIDAFVEGPGISIDHIMLMGG